MMIHGVTAPRLKNPGRLFYYRCRKRNRDGHEACTNGKCHRADEVEPLVWEFVSGLLREPERLRAGLERLIEQERQAMRGNPEQEVKAWLEKLSGVDQERRGFLRLAAKGHITDEELAEELAALDETRETAERELQALQGRRKVIEELERDRDALLKSYALMVPEALDRLEPSERHQVYKMLRLQVLIHRDGSLEVSGVFGNTFVSENQDEDVLLAQDQVQLPVAGAVVPFDELVPPPRQVAQGELFAPRAGEPVAQPPTPA